MRGFTFCGAITCILVFSSGSFARVDPEAEKLCDSLGGTRKNACGDGETKLSVGNLGLATVCCAKDESEKFEQVCKSKNGVVEQLCNPTHPEALFSWPFGRRTSICCGPKVEDKKKETCRWVSLNQLEMRGSECSSGVCDGKIKHVCVGNVVCEDGKQIEVGCAAEQRCGSVSINDCISDQKVQVE